MSQDPYNFCKFGLRYLHATPSRVWSLAGGFREGASGLTQACTQMERGQCDVCVHCLRSIRSWSSMFVSTPGHVVCDVCTHSVIQLWTSSVMPTLRCLSIPSILGTALVRMLCYL